MIISEAYNTYIYESVLVLDCADPRPKMTLIGGVALDQDTLQQGNTADAAKEARKHEKPRVN